jgi:hypothetical protein
MTESSEGLSLRLYREAEQQQLQDKLLHSTILFGLSMHAMSQDIHPNAAYQMCWNLACLQEWELCAEALNVLLTHYPIHEAGNYLRDILKLMETSSSGGESIAAERLRQSQKSFRSPRELRRLIETQSS